MTDTCQSDTERSEVPISRGKRVYLNAEELWQLRRDIEMVRDADENVPPGEDARRDSYERKIGMIHS